jgi:hypothetical protein
METPLTEIFPSLNSIDGPNKPLINISFNPMSGGFINLKPTGDTKSSKPLKTMVFGYSDDIISIDGSISDEKPHDSDKAAAITASDGTKARIKLNNKGIWNIIVDVKGSKYISLVPAVGEGEKHTIEGLKDCSPYSDILLLDEGIEWVKIGSKTFKNK